ncbi:MAG: glycosyltransferase family 2 protein [Candidatus Magnetoovum sp. WYHC-5]|nr:glycosyltransferase family 2 protein [Candidatus Magnetoovum sp. WYHC-5]
MDIRKKILQFLYKVFPFPLKADANLLSTVDSSIELSCIINFYGRIDLLEGILFCLSSQSLDKSRFEVVLIEDRGGTEAGKKTAVKFAQKLEDKLNIKYVPLLDNFGKMGYSRNIGLINSSGKYILFLDDDTLIHQRDFLSLFLNEFAKAGVDSVVPRGSASFCTIKDRYDFHDPFFPSNRCTGYTREAIAELGGFVSNIVGQEEVEFLIRFIAAGKKHSYTSLIQYYHPPYILNSLNKAKAVGLSFGNLRHRYPFVVWSLILLNGMRHLPQIFIPVNTKLKTHGMFGLGFFIGVVLSFFNKEVSYK